MTNNYPLTLKLCFWPNGVNYNYAQSLGFQEKDDKGFLVVPSSVVYTKAIDLSAYEEKIKQEF